MVDNEIRFAVQWREGLDVEEVIACIDEVPLTTLIDQFEVGAAMSPAGGAYGGLIPAYDRFESLEEHFHGRSPLEMGTGTKTPVLGCECGECGCWPLLADISACEELVVWDSFEQPHRPTRDYTGFGPFWFDRGQYDDALRSCRGVW